MHKIILSFGAMFAIALGLTLPVSAKRMQEKPDHTKWVAESLTDMETIKVGMTRADLLKVFMEEGGVSTRSSRTYAYRDCPYFKVTVQFAPIGAVEKFGESQKDKIIKISQPFLQRMVLD